jgi:hypothetical protein
MLPGQSILADKEQEAEGCNKEQGHSLVPRQSVQGDFCNDIDDLQHQLQKLKLDTNLQPQQALQLRRSTREKKRPSKFSDYELLYLEEAEPELLISNQTEPVTYKEACKAIDSVKWQEAMKDEMNSLQANNTWDLVQLPPNRRPLKNHWVYKLKEEDGGQKRYHARLVVKGYDQQKGIDFNEIFSPVVRMTTISRGILLFSTIVFTMNTTASNIMSYCIQNMKSHILEGSK